jgi:anti-sigma-K factor RskA
VSALPPEELEALLGAYALDAVDADEARAVEEYLARNPRARAEVQQHREVATMLAFTGAPAPEGLWDRIASTIEDHAPEPGPELAKVLPARRRRPRAWTIAAVAAAVAAIVGVLTFGFVERGRQIDRLEAQAGERVDLERLMADALADPAARVLDLQSDDAALTARAVIEPDGTGFLDADALPALEGQDYQLWGLIGDDLISLGVLGSRPRISTFTVQGDLKALAITEERPGGVPRSEQPAALQGELI